MVARVRVVMCLQSDLWRVVIAPGSGVADGGIPHDFQESWIPVHARFPNCEFWIDGFADGIPRVVDHVQVK